MMENSEIEMNSANGLSMQSMETCGVVGCNGVPMTVFPCNCEMVICAECFREAAGKKGNGLCPACQQPYDLGQMRPRRMGNKVVTWEDLLDNENRGHGFNRSNYDSDRNSGASGWQRENGEARELYHDDDVRLAESMSERLAELSRLERPNRNNTLTIFKIPGYIRRKHEALYEPQIISIGPYHRGAQSLEPMEEQKWKSLQRLLQETAYCRLIELVNSVRYLESDARSAYKESMSLPVGDEFVKMMVLDACFIIQFLSNSEHGKVASDVSAVISDLLLLENQIPFFIISTLYSRIFPYKEIEELYSLLANFMFSASDFDELKQRPADEEPVHLVHLYYQWFLLTANAPRTPIPSFLGHQSQLSSIIKGIHSFQSQLCICFTKHCGKKLMEEGSHSLPSQAVISSTERSHSLPSQTVISSTERSHSLPTPTVISSQTVISSTVPTVKVTTTAPIKVIPPVTTLREAGVKFQRRASRRNLFSVTFDKGVIEISSIILDNNRKRLFLNLIALEQSQVEWNKDLTSFAKLMDMLIDTPKDVAILEQCGILHNLLASAEEATCFFNEICECAAVDYNNNYLDELIHEVREFHNSKWHRRRAKLMHDYFNSPWSVISFIGGILLLIMTFL